MTAKQITLQYNGNTLSVRGGETYEAVAKRLQNEYEHAIVLMLENGELRELFRSAKDGAVIRPVTTAETAGHKTYQRSMNLLLYRAFSDVTKGEQKLVLHFSHSTGYFYRIVGTDSVSNELLDKLRDRMRELSDQAIPIRKRSLRTSEARALFRAKGMDDKDELFRYRRTSSVNLYSIGEYEDYNYGFMVPDTSYLNCFELQAYQDGFVLILPEQNDPESVPPFEPSEKLFDAQKRAERWGMKTGVDTVGRLNRVITSQKIEHTILVEEALQESRIAEIARQIAEHGDVKAVLIAGPSSSGKTTFSRRLSIQLAAHGLSPHPISMDNYYKERKDTPRDADGNYDFECVEALDLELFERQVLELLDGKEVELPRYDFTKGGKDFKGDMLRLGANDILIFEGIHGLNEQVSSFIPKERKFKIYISALTQLNIDDHNRIPTTDARLIRRIVRDYRTRATSARETIAMWNSVRRGEDRYIFPYQESADVIYNSAMTYELPVLKIYAEPLLFQIRERDAEYLEAKRLLKFLDYFVGIPSETIPNNSVLREFIGGSCFDV